MATGNAHFRAQILSVSVYVQKIWHPGLRLANDLALGQTNATTDHQSDVRVYFLF